MIIQQIESRMDRVTKSLTEIIQTFDEILSGHPSPIYQELLEVYTKALTDYQKAKDLENLKSRIRWTDRTIMEAPAWIRELGLKLLTQITGLYAYLPN